MITTATSLALPMVVNALVTGLIVFKILKVFLKVTPILDEATLGPTLDTKLQVQRVIFLIIESGMALFAIQLIAIVLFIVFYIVTGPVPVDFKLESRRHTIFGLVASIYQMSVIIRSVHIYFSCFTDNIYQGIIPTIILLRVSMNLSFDDKESFEEATGSLCFHQSNPPSDPNTSSMPPQGPQLGPQGQPDSGERSEGTT